MHLAPPHRQLHPAGYTPGGCLTAWLLTPTLAATKAAAMKTTAGPMSFKQKAWFQSFGHYKYKHLHAHKFTRDGSQTIIAQGKAYQANFKKSEL